MIEIIKEIPGPYFLLVYCVFSALIILLAKKFAEMDSTKEMETPEPSEISPLDIALLNKGIKGAVIVSIFNLWKEKRIEIKKVKNNITLKQISADVSGLNRLESVILKNTSNQKYYRHFFTKKSIKTIQDILQPNKDNLEKLNLLPNSEVKNRYWFVSLLSVAILILFGGTKFILGISRDKPVAFLFMLIVLSIIALFFYIKPHKLRYTALGSRFIASSSQRFEWLKKNDSNSLMADDNLLYGVALFGISAFIGSGLGQFLENPRLLETYAGSNYGYGCGGASCGGGGCSGGSGCGGGGCGGCGGCGGGD
jgi:uncharacterized protein (TIGR04222 family)